jgi:hypothetical protein
MCDALVNRALVLAFFSFHEKACCVFLVLALSIWALLAGDHALVLHYLLYS